MTDLAIVVPMLGRPHRVAPLIESIEATTPHARVVFVCSPDDRHVHDAIHSTGRERLTVPGPRPGDYARKINAGIEHTDEPLIFMAADDLLFHPGWFQAATAMLTDGIGVVGTNDLGNPRVIRGEHSTHSLITRDYVERFGTIDEPGKAMHEGYHHEFCDDELVETAKHRNAWAFAADSIVEHLHPHWGKAPTDSIYDAQRARMRASRQHYRRRQRLWT